ncbi:MAG TPA: glutaredoxin family protein [Burkholderiaceae bacterium]
MKPDTMKPDFRFFRPLLPLLLFAAAGGAHAQLYKWTDAAGKVHFTSTPPPASAAKVEQRSVPASGSASTDGLPFALAEAVRNFPVTLYSAPKCAPCDQGRALLQRRGIPFAEKTVQTQDDIARLRQAGGGEQLPFLTVGRTRLSAFEAGAWNSALSSATYPESSQLPRTYAARAAEPAAGPVIVAKAPEPSAQEQDARPDNAVPSALPPAQGTNVPPGFRF